MDLVNSVDSFITALTLWREARGESRSVQEAIYWVIRNRVEDPRWPSSYASVCLFSSFSSKTNKRVWHFSSFSPGDSNSTKWPVPNGIPMLDWTAWQQCCDIVENPPVVDPTNGCNHYHTFKNAENYPSWAQGVQPFLVLGPVKFYKL